MSSSTNLFHFFAVIREGHDRYLQRIRTQQTLQKELTNFFDKQAKEFLDSDIERVDFDPRFKPDVEHVFAITNFSIPEEFLNAARYPNQFDTLNIKKSSYYQSGVCDLL